MRPEDWQRIEALFHEAVGMSAAAREALLSGVEEAVARQVRAMLAADQPRDLTLEHVVRGTAAAWLDQGASFELQPDRLGPYRILRSLGTGGMGAVFLAQRDDAEYDKQVAIKILRAGALSGDAVERFRRERQILAQLDHPYTARLLDGGTMPDGRPYLVMEYVEGEPITTYSKRMGLSARERCELLGKVCEAVSHAHQGLIVHRDLKPANILVDSRGNPRLLDFGIAKLMNPELAPETSQVFLTPQYASPEQLRGEAITTAADIYSLGAVLYEMLTEAPPHDTGLARLREKDLAPPSRRSTRLVIAQDLDNIVLKAMATEPGRRYRSVDQFAEDLARYLRGEAVLARGNSIVYRAGKFVKRSWLPLAAAASAVLTLAVSAYHSRNQAIEAERLRALAVAEAAETRQARDESERQRVRAEASAIESRKLEQLAASSAEEARRGLSQLRSLSGRLLFELHDSIAKLPGATEARRLVVGTALEQYDRLAKEGGSDRELMRQLATAYQRIGDVQGKPSQPNLGDMSGALTSYRKSIALRQPLVSGDAGQAVEQLKTMASLADVERQMGQMEASQKTLAAAMAWSDQHPEWGAEGRLARVGLHRVKARILMAREWQDSHADFQRALVLLDGLPDGIRKSEAARSERLSVLNLYVRALLDLPEALHFSDEAVKLAQEFYDGNPNEAIHASRLFQVLTARADAFRRMKTPRLDEAAELSRKALALAQDLMKADPVNAQARGDVALAWNRVGLVEQARKRVDAAVAAFAEGAKVSEAIHRDFPDSLDALDTYANSLFRAGETLYRVGRYADSAPYLEKAYPLLGKLKTLDRKRISAFQSHYAVEYFMAKIAFELKRYRECVEFTQRVVAYGRQYSNNRVAQGRAANIENLTLLGDAWAKLGDWKQAKAAWEEAKAIPDANVAELERRIAEALSILAATR